MSNKTNIEDIFKNTFESYQVKPSSMTWFKVQNLVLPARVKYLYQKSFTNFNTTPSSSIWSKINMRLFWYRFMYFNPYTFNVYYLALVGLVAGGSILTVNATSDTKPNQSADVVAINNRIDNFFSRTTADFTKLKNIVIIAQGNKIENNINTHNNLVVANESAQASNRKNQGIGENVSIPKNDVVVENVAKIVESGNQAYGFDMIPELLPKSDAAMVNKIYLTRISKTMPLLHYNPLPDSWEKSALMAYQYKLPIVPDTIGKNYKGEPIVVAGSYVSIEPNYSGFYGATKIFSNNPEIREGLQGNALDFTGLYSYSYGINVALQQHHLRLLSGLNYSVSNETYAQHKLTTLIENRFNYEPYNYNAWVNDTTWLLDLDAWLLGDTVYFAHIDSTYTSLTDSTLHIVADTSYRTDTLFYKNRLTYFEIPLIAGYTIDLKNWSLTPQTGFVFGFLSGANGSYPSSAEQSYAMNNMYPLRPVNISWYAGFNMRYYFAKNIGVMVEPWYSKNLMSIYKNDMDIRRSDSHFGVRFGLSIRI